MTIHSHLDHLRKPFRARRRHITRLAALVAVSGVLVFATMNAQRPAAPRPLVFDRVTVVDVEQGRLIPAQRVVIVGNRITTMGNAGKVSIPRGAQVVDAQGKYLIPGLWDMHTHSRRYTDFFYPLFIANGVTGIRDAWSQVPLDTIIQWRREIVAGTRVGPPRQLLAGPALDKVQQCPRGRGLDNGRLCLATAADARRVVDSLKAAGADFIKTYYLDDTLYFAVAAEAKRIGIPFGGHLSATTAMIASDSGASILDHPNTSGDLGERCGGSNAGQAVSGGQRPVSKTASVEKCAPLAERFKRNGTWWVPTLIPFDTRTYAFHYDFSALTTLEARNIVARFFAFASEFWKGSTLRPTGFRDSTKGAAPPGTTQSDSLGVLRIAHRVGMPILIGTDVNSSEMKVQPPGFSLHAELAMEVAEGLTPLEALQAVTVNPAKYLHGTDSLGTVAAGKLADLVLLDANPLADIANTMTIRAVVANGRYFDRAALDRLLTDVQAKAKQEPQPFGDARN